jgi:hypothetical protein
VFRLSTRILATLALVAGGATLATSAGAQGTVPPTSIGYDISFPQCGANLPAPAGFAVIGVNFGHPRSTNPCLASELNWAKNALSAAPQFYANTDNPGPADAADWPVSQSAPQVCHGANSTACSYDYGWNAAQNSFHNAVAAESQTGSASPSADARQALWWLDVESGNHWETIEGNYGPTASSFSNDQAELSGEVDYLTSVGVAFVGIYSTHSMFKGLIGSTGTQFATNQGWVPGYATLASAQAACASTSFTGARTAMIQYPSRGLDGDYLCPLITTPGGTSTSVAASPTFSAQLSVAGDSAAVTFTQTSGAPSLLVSPSGAVTTSGTLQDGTYVASGTTSDANGIDGTFSYTLSVGTITQVAPTTFASSVAGTASYSDQIDVTDSSGAVTFVQTTGAPSLVVSPTGLVTTGGQLAPGSYVARGAMSDVAGDKGTFFYHLVVGTMTQSSPLKATVTANDLATYSSQIAVTGSSGPVTFVQTAGSPNVVVSATGLVTASSSLAPGSYVARGTTSDAGGDKGTFFFNLLVKAAPLPNVPPVALRVLGHVVPGRTVVVRITGAGFYGQPRVTSHAGTVARVIHDSGTMLTLLVRAAPRSRNGVFTFTITLANGQSCTIRYNQHP